MEQHVLFLQKLRRWIVQQNTGKGQNINSPLHLRARPSRWGVFPFGKLSFTTENYHRDGIIAKFLSCLAVTCSVAASLEGEGPKMAERIVKNEAPDSRRWVMPFGCGSTFLPSVRCWAPFSPGVLFGQFFEMMTKSCPQNYESSARVSRLQGS